MALDPQPERLLQIVDALDCFTEQDVQQLTDSKQETLSQWRKRGEGPAYIRAGNRFLYPRVAVAEWLSGKVKVRRDVEPKSFL